MRKTIGPLYLSVFIASTMLFAPLCAEGKTINWAEDINPGDVETNLRNAPFFAGNTVRSLYIDSSATGNTLNINSNSIGGSAFAALSDTGDVTYNTLNITGGTVGADGNPTGADAVGGYSNSGAATYNTVNMSAGTVTRSIIGGMSFAGDGAHNNTVNFSGGSTKDIYGGFVNSATHNGTASYNTINITAGTVTGIISGGDGSNGSDNYNVVNISGNPILAGTTIAGGNSGSTGSHDSKIGNVLNMDWTGSIASLRNFEKMNFVVSDAVFANGNTILNVAQVSRIQDSEIRITSFRGKHQWSVGDQITVISKSDGTSTLFGGSAKIGLAHKFDYDMLYDGTINNGVLAQITGYAVNEDAGDLPSGTGSTNEFLKGTSELIDSADLVEELDGLSRLIGVVRHSRSEFGSGSTADVNGTALLLGASRKYQGDKGYTMLGGFFEAGWGSYNTHSKFSSDNEINSNGKTNYHGLGVAARNIRDNGVYTAATLHLGRAFTHQQGTNLTDTAGNMASYDTDSMYYGLNLGVGKVIKLNEANELDVYGKYLFLHQTGSNKTILGDQVNFDAINSHRLRAGAKLSHQANSNLNTYLDLAYEYEFNGKASAHVAGGELPYISVKGGTAIAEIGFVYKPKAAKNFETKLGFQGYIGKRQGYAGNLNLVWKF